jgi:hypothetical protein
MLVRRITRLALAASLALACFAFAGGARAENPTPAAIALAKELVALKGGAAMFDRLIPGVVERAKNSFVPTNPQLMGPLTEVAERLKKEYGPKSAEITNEVARVYAEHFTEAELRDIVAFYKSPAGRKMAAEEPKAIEQTLRAANEWAAKFSDVVLERFRVEMKKKGHDL